MKHSFSILAVLFLFGVSSLFAQNTVTHSAITFKVKNLGIYANGTFGSLQAKVHFSPANLTDADIEATVETSTVNTDNSLRDDHIKSDEFLDIAHYPKITIKSVAIKHKSGNKYIGQFNLTIKNKTLPVEIPFILIQNGDSMEFKGSFSINRRDYNVGNNSLTLSDEIVISIDAEFHQ
jgi:polyisoprenoid-binding protein YceI